MGPRACTTPVQLNPFLANFRKGFKGISMSAITTEIIAKDQASFTELIDDREGIILDLENLHYYMLNATAVFLWKRIRSGPGTASATYATPENLSAALSDAFAVNAGLAELDTRVFLDELECNGLIRYVEHDLGPTGARAAGRTLSGGRDDLPAYEPPQLQLSNTLMQVTQFGS
jgi:hypothetical protein